MEQKEKKLHLVKKIGPARPSARHRTTGEKNGRVPAAGGASHGPTTAGSSSRGLLLLSAAAASEEAA